VVPLRKMTADSDRRAKFENPPDRFGPAEALQIATSGIEH
jgi:hypothetical protein